MSDVKFEDLDPETRDFLASLDREKVVEMKEAIRFMAGAKTVSRFFRWCVISFVAFFLTVAALGDAWEKVRHWMLGR